MAEVKNGKIYQMGNKPDAEDGGQEPSDNGGGGS